MQETKSISKIFVDLQIMWEHVPRHKSNLAGIFDEFLSNLLQYNEFVGQSGVRALPLAAGRSVGGHYKWHYWSERVACASGAN